jgi:hypothetical protein
MALPRDYSRTTLLQRRIFESASALHDGITTMDPSEGSIRYTPFAITANSARRRKIKGA